MKLSAASNTCSPPLAAPETTCLALERAPGQAGLRPSLCGRTEERTQLQRHLTRALHGRGGVVIIEGRAGMGRRRLAGEACRQARERGMSVVRIDGVTQGRPNAAAHALAQALADTVPEEAADAFARHADVLADTAPEVLARAGVASAAQAIPVGPASAGARSGDLQDTLVEIFLEVAEHRPLVVVVDDVHTMDPGSAGLLSALGHRASRARLLVVTTRRDDVPPEAAVQRVLQVAARIRLRALPQTAVDELVASAFGSVPDRAQLVAWLMSLARGNPGQTLQLLSTLVDRGIVRQAGESWVLPDRLAEQRLPENLEQALSERIQDLTAPALRMVRMLALHPGGMSLSLCHALASPAEDRTSLYAALDELLARELVTTSGETYRLRDDTLTELVLAGLPDAERAALHAELGNALCSLLGLSRARHFDRDLARRDPTHLARAIQAGWHLFHTGDGARGRALLRAASIELAYGGQGLSPAVPALEAALQTYREAGRSRFECAYLMVPLTLAGTYSDFRLNYRHGEPLLEILDSASGMDVARRLDRFVGRRLGLWVGLAVACVSHQIGAARLAGRSFRESFLGLIGLATAVIGASAPLLDGERCQRLLSRMRPLLAFPRAHPAHVIHELLTAMTDCAFGRYAQASERTLAVCARLQSRETAALLPDAARDQLKDGTHVLLSTLHWPRVDELARASVDALEASCSVYARQAAASFRAMHHAGRGELKLFELHRERVDALAAQNGTVGRQDALFARELWWPFTLCEDVMGLKRSLHQLETLCEEAPSLASMRDAARASYLTARGKPQEALDRHEATLTQALTTPTAMAAQLATVYARALRAVGQPARARDVCDRVLRQLDRAQLSFRVLTLPATLEGALATAEAGDSEEAARMLAALDEGGWTGDNPLLRGLLARTRARLALSLGDGETFRSHRARARASFRGTDNPALAALVQELTRRGRAAGLLSDSEGNPSLRSGAAPELSALRAVFAASTDPDRRLQAVLDTVIDLAQADRGFLYLWDAGGMRLAAPLIGVEPPDALRAELEAELQALTTDPASPSRADAPLGTLTTPVETVDAHHGSDSPQGARYRSHILTCHGPDGRRAVGAVALVETDAPLCPLPSALAHELAQWLDALGDPRAHVRRQSP